MQKQCTTGAAEYVLLLQELEQAGRVDTIHTERSAVSHSDDTNRYGDYLMHARKVQVGT